MTGSGASSGGGGAPSGGGGGGAPSGGGGGGPNPNPQTAPVFASAPNLGTDILDYADKAGIKAFEKATKPLKSEFDGGKSNTTVFKEQLSDHA